MNFFECQDKARSKTLFLIFGFVLSVICIMLLIDGALLLYKKWVITYADTGILYNEVSFPSFNLWFINSIIIILFFIGCLYKYIDLQAGGSAIVKMMDAEPADRDHPDAAVKQLIDIVDEISIASGVASPMIYILPEEKGINAFVAGFNPNDTVLVVTQGCLDNLSRDEMQGVIAHEFSHIFNSDCAINLRLMIILGGLFIISQAGNVFMRARDQDNSGFIIVGLILYVLGLIGVFFGSLLKAAISRQRETLADASAVQYTRDPNGIVRALLKIQQQGKTALMQNKKAEEVNHMCFSKARDLNFLGLFASHPKLSLRIAMLDPTGEIRAAFMQNSSQAPKPAPVAANPATQAAAQNMVKNILTGGVLISGANIVSSIGNPTAHSLSHAETILQSIPPQLKQMLSDKIGTQALMYAIALKMGSDSVMARIQAGLSPDMLSKINTCLTYTEITHAPYRAILTNISIPVLKKISQDEKKLFLKNIYTILETDINLSKAILLTILNQRMNEDSFKGLKPKYSKFDQIEQEATCILWYMAQQSSVAEDDQNQAFKQSLQQLDKNFSQNLKEIYFDIQQLIKSLIKLRLMMPDLKQQFLAACVTCMQADGQVNIQEIELLRAICSCLDCPLPLLHPVPTGNH